MQKTISNFINNHQLLSKEDITIVTVSGGADSVALMHVLYSLKYPCILAHCNFHLRGEESNRDENFVKKLAEKFQLKYHIKHFDTIGYAKEKGISIEMAARELRYNWFYQLAEEENAQAIATAHHADDNIETMLMNLIRGTGLRGLTGIPYRNGKVVRPLLNVSRAEIEMYLKEHQLDYVTDSTNLQNDYRRNKIRNEVLPLLEKVNPAVRKVLYNSVGYFNDAYGIYQKAVEEIVAEISTNENNTLKIDIEKLKQQEHPQTILFEVLQPLGFTGVAVKQIYDNINGESGKQFFSDTHAVLRNREELIVTEHKLIEKKHYYITENDTEITEPIRLKLKKLKKTPDFRLKSDRNKIYVDLSKIKFPLEIRHWQEGDLFQPFGMKGKKKVSDFFIDQKLSIIEKEQCLLLLSGENIVWIISQRADDRFKVNPDTKDILEISVQ